MTLCHAIRMAQMTVRLDDRLAETAKAEAAAAGKNLSDWVRDAIAHQARLATALRARAEEDARGSLYTPEQEDALMAERQRRAVAAFER